MPRRNRRGNTLGQKYESYRLDAVTYVTNRDQKIEEMVADLHRKYPRQPIAYLRSLVVAQWAELEAANDVRNTVRSLDIGFDERGLMDRINRKIGAGDRGMPEATVHALESLLTGRERPPEYPSASLLDSVISDVLRGSQGRRA